RLKASAHHKQHMASASAGAVCFDLMPLPDGMMMMAPTTMTAATLPTETTMPALATAATVAVVATPATAAAPTLLLTPLLLHQAVCSHRTCRMRQAAACLPDRDSPAPGIDHAAHALLQHTSDRASSAACEAGPCASSALLER